MIVVLVSPADGPDRWWPSALVRGHPEVDAVVVSKVREARAAAARRRRAWLPPRWFVVLFWHGHRALARVTCGRLGLWRPKPDGWGALRLTTAGRRTGRPRQVLVGYVEDGRNLVTMAMNGWGAAEPAWWLNLQAHPDATAQTRDGARRSGRAGPRETSASGCGPAGPRSTRTSTVAVHLCPFPCPAPTLSYWPSPGASSPGTPGPSCSSAARSCSWKGMASPRRARPRRSARMKYPHRRSRPMPSTRC